MRRWSYHTLSLWLLITAFLQGAVKAVGLAVDWAVGLGVEMAVGLVVETAVDSAVGLAVG